MAAPTTRPTRPPSGAGRPAGPFPRCPSMWDRMARSPRPADSRAKSARTEGVTQMAASNSAPDVPTDNPSVGPLARRAGWLDERLDLRAFHRKYGRKVFPVHSTFFLGEMALFSFVILVLTGAYLGFVYVPSNATVT